jgi:cellulose synthase/poly-beta-1,6-N-acetylglucosamine synthase-like glycosyltransferase
MTERSPSGHAHARPPRSDLVRGSSIGSTEPTRAKVTVLGPAPEMSAATTLSTGQRRVLIATTIGLLVLLVLAPVATLTALVAAATALYIAVFLFRFRIFVTALRGTYTIDVPDDEARAIPDAELPVYTILVPAYHEPQVIGRLIEGLSRLEYPWSRLDVQLLLEEDDAETIAAAEAAKPNRHISIVRVPYSEPRTKPKACNHGLLRARGELVTIYDAEDRPEPLQLRRAVAAFRRLGPDVACLQAKLSYHNANQNMLTRWFTAEYGMWFMHFLPGLVARNAPIPLGGTSNHFRREILEGIGAWDPHNVTEDADLGVRLHRAGYRTQVLDSTTYEEANSDFVNWVKQRSRWYKGYLQTWLIHMRDPKRLWRELGAKGVVEFTLFVLGTPLLAMLSPVFWALTVLWFLGQPPEIAALFPGWVYYLGLFALVFGNFSFLYLTMVGSYRLRDPRIVIAALFTPIYWVMMSIAAIKALVQLLHAPSFWEKTVHGLDQIPDASLSKRAA